MEIEIENNDKYGCIDIAKHPITGVIITDAEFEAMGNTKFQVLPGVENYKTPNETYEYFQKRFGSLVKKES